MTTTLNASTSGGGGLIQSADSSGILALQTGGTTAVTIDASQRVGVGTASPTQKLTVSGNLSFTTSENSITWASGNGIVEAPSTLYLRSTGAGNVIFQTNGSERLRIDSSGNLGLGVTPSTFSTGKAFEVGFAGNAINGFESGSLAITSGTYYNNAWYRANTFASGYMQYYRGELRWYTGTAGTAGTTYTPNQAMTLDASGNLLVGQTSAGVANSTSYAFTLDGNGIRNNHGNGTPSGYSYMLFGYNGSSIGSITQNGTTAVAYNTTSDYRLKENVQPLSGALARVTALKPCTYTWKSAPDEIGEGFIAHELAEVCPQAVTGEKDAVDEDGSIKPQSIDTSFLVATLTAAIQEQQAIITSLTARITALEGAK